MKSESSNEKQACFQIRVTPTPKSPVTDYFVILTDQGLLLHSTKSISPNENLKCDNLADEDDKPSLFDLLYSQAHFWELRMKKIAEFTDERNSGKFDKEDPIVNTYPFSNCKWENIKKLKSDRAHIFTFTCDIKGPEDPAKAKDHPEDPAKIIMTVIAQKVL